MPSDSRGSSVSRNPAVSIRDIIDLSTATSCIRESLVVPGISETMEPFCPSK